MGSDESRTSRRLGTLGGIATVEVLLRGIGGTSIVDLLELVTEGVLIALAIGLSSGSTGQSLSAVATWGLYTYGIYTFLPGLFPEWLSDLAADRVFVGLVALGSVVIAQPITSLLGGTRQVVVTGGSATGGTGGYLQVGFLLTILWFGVLWLHFRFIRDEGILSDGSVTRRLLAQMDAADRYFEIPPDERTLAESLQVTIARFVGPLTFAFLSFGLAIFVAVISRLYPIPELLFVVAAVGSPILSRTDRFGTAGDIDIELEQDLGTAVFTVLRSEKGHGIAVSTMLGVFVAGLMFFAGLFTVRRVPLALDRATMALAGGASGVFSPLVLSAWTTIGAGVTLLCCAGLLLWLWLRLARRSPAFSTAWNNRWASTDAAEPSPSLRRPVGGALLPVVLASGAGLFVFDTPQADWLLLGYCLLWPVGLLAGVYWVYHTRTRPPQSPLTDNWQYPVSCTVEFLWILVIALASPVATASFESGFAFILLLLFVLYFQPDIAKRLEARPEPWPMVADGTVALLAVPMLALSVVWPQYAIYGVVSAVVAVLGGALSVATEYQSATE